MHLTKVLWPEVFKGTRGPERFREDFHRLQSGLVWGPDGIDSLPMEDLPELLRFFTTDPNSSLAIIHAAMHLRKKAPTYHLCRDFCQALWDIPDRELPIEMIPDGFLGYISFPKGLITDSVQIPNTGKVGEDIAGAYLWVGTCDDTTPFVKELRGKRIAWISYLGDIGDAFNQNRYPGFGRLVFDPAPGHSVSEMLGDIETRDYVHNEFGKHLKPILNGEAEFRRKLASLVLNAAIYINSDDPDILSLTPTFGASKQQIAKHTKNGHQNGCTIPVQAVSWDYKRISANFEDAETFVSTHPRWQRCGPGFQSIKLIWVKEHVRTYRKQVEILTPIDAQ